MDPLMVKIRPVWSHTPAVGMPVLVGEDVFAGRQQPNVFRLGPSCGFRYQELPGPKDVRSTMIYTHVLNRGRRAVAVPPTGRLALPIER
jgi:hypothetical protein